MSVLKVVIHSVDNQLDTVILSEKMINLSQNVALDDYILKMFVAFKKSSATSKGKLLEGSFLKDNIGSSEFDFMALSKEIAQDWFDHYQGSNTYTSLNLIFTMVETEESVEYAMFEVMGRAGYLKVDDDIEQNMGILSDSFASCKAAFSFDLESGNLWVKVTQNTQDYLEDILGFETIPNAKKTLEIVDAMIDYVSTSRNENVLDNKIKSKQFVLDAAELFDEVEPKRIINHVFESLDSEELGFIEDTVNETHLPSLIDSTHVNRLSSRKKHRILTDFGIEVILPIASMKVDEVLEVIEQENGQVDIILKNVGKVL